MNLQKIIGTLSSKREIFHSEADFQFALAWEIQKEYKNAKVRLEYCPKHAKNEHIDIVVILEKKIYPIELKYKTKKLVIDKDDEQYELKSHKAHPNNVSKYENDIERINDFKQNHKEIFGCGFAIMLTNDCLYENKIKAKWENYSEIREKNAVFKYCITKIE